MNRLDLIAEVLLKALASPDPAAVPPVAGTKMRKAKRAKKGK